MKRREYTLNVVVNEILIAKVIIDPHYEEKHSESIDDRIILALVKLLNGKMFEPIEKKGPYHYFVVDLLELKGKYYRLIWLLEEHNVYIGVINAYRRRLCHSQKNLSLIKF